MFHKQYRGFPVFLMLGISAAQQCCVWPGLTKSTASLASLMAAPTVAPESSCASPYTWTACSTGCISVKCTGTFQGSQGTVFAGGCTGNGDPTVETATTALVANGGVGSCSSIQSYTKNSDNSITTNPPQTAVMTKTNSAAPSSFGCVYYVLPMLVIAASMVSL
jgi:hypothetical protein